MPTPDCVVSGIGGLGGSGSAMLAEGELCDDIGSFAADWVSAGPAPWIAYILTDPGASGTPEFPVAIGFGDLCQGI